MNMKEKLVLAYSGGLDPLFQLNGYQTQDMM